MTFDEAGYLEANPDVAIAISAGQFTSAHEHYTKFGMSEGRPLAIADSRDGRALAGLRLAEMTGIEIGALTAPLVTPSKGRITYVDHASTAELIKKYRDNPSIDPKKIVHVGAIWGNNTLRQAIGGDELFDYALASHVIEHVPNIIGWLQEVREVLKADGSLRLYIPDKRFDFDYLRPEATIADALDAYVRKTRVPLPRMIIDHHTNYMEIDIADAWAGKRAQKTEWKSDCERSIETARNALENEVYYDTHCWVVTPRSFAKIMERCSELGIMEFCCEWFHDTQEMQLEFLVAMSPCQDEKKRTRSWKDMAESAKEYAWLHDNG